ncbi:MAG: glycosyltransferase family 39 protein [Cytophagaceae bacterium]|jgi:hypothetical protein|nr:glycosyltransferase family 39 protein [Cytophagaceae bacterium]
MVVTGLLLSFVLGLAVVSAISHRFSWAEKTGLSFITGIGIQTALMVLMDAISIPLTVISVFAASAVVLGVALFFCWKKRIYLINNIKTFGLKNINFRQYTLLWAVLLIMTGYIEYFNWAKCMFFPTFDRDSIVGFDFMGRVIASEHAMGESTYFQSTELGGMEGASYTHYTPLVHLSYAYVYMLGAQMSKVINALFFLSFIFSFYAALKRILTPTFAAMTLLLTMLVPEFISFTSLSATNALHAIYASLAVMYAMLYFKTDERRYFSMTVVLSALNVWTRQEGIVFIAAIAFVMLLKAIKVKKLKDVAVYCGITVAPFVFWLVYLKIFGLGSQSESMNLLPFWDSTKLSTIVKMGWEVLKNINFYSVTFYVFAATILASLYFMIKEKRGYELLTMFVVSLLLFVVVIYQVEYNWDSLENVMRYSFKRFMFCFVPLAWAFVFTNPLVEKVNNWLKLKL